MTTSRKIFIYNGTGVGPASTTDLYTLFTTSEKIFPSRADVVLSDFNFKFDQLEDPVFVVPGGSTSSIGFNLRSQMEKIKSHFNENFGYVGVCAGAFLGASDAELFITNHLRENDKYFQPASYQYTTKQTKINLNIIKNCRAFGAFYPNDSQLAVPDIASKAIVPYRVTVGFPETTRTLSQLYLAGPVLVTELDDETKISTDIIANYVGRENFTLFSHRKIPSDKLSAIVRTLPEENKGGKLLAATHIESCVAESRLMDLFKNGGPKCASINKEDYALLVREQKEAQEQVESLLRDTLNKRSGPN